MNKKVLIYLLLFASAEMYFYQKVASNGLEMFFWVWTFIFVALFLYTNFNMMNMDGYGSTTFTFWKNSNSRMNKDSRNNSAFNLVKNEINSVYLVFIIINVIGYVVVMPK
jgi:hypothetical protein